MHGFWLVVTIDDKMKVKSMKNDKSAMGTWLAIIVFGIALCGAFYQYQIHGTLRDSSIAINTSMGIADINNTASASKDLNETNNTTNQSTLTVPLEKPPFID